MSAEVRAPASPHLPAIQASGDGDTQGLEVKGLLRYQLFGFDTETPSLAVDSLDSSCPERRCARAPQGCGTSGLPGRGRHRGGREGPGGKRRDPEKPM